MEIINNENNNFDRLDNNDHNESLTIIEMKIRSTVTIPTGMETRATVTGMTVMKTVVALRAVTKVKQ
jgi:hypothetical protein